MIIPKTRINMMEAIDDTLLNMVKGNISHTSVI
jgi:hypothetical protein